MKKYKITGFKPSVTDPSLEVERYEIAGFGKTTIRKRNLLLELLKERVDSFPVVGVDTGAVGDQGLPVVTLPNGKTINLFYLEYEEILYDKNELV